MNVVGTHTGMDLSSDKARGSLSPEIAALMERASRKRHMIETESGFTAYVSEHRASAIQAKNPAVKVYAPK